MERRRREGGRAENWRQMGSGGDRGVMWWGGEGGYMRAVMGQGSRGRGRERRCMPPLINVRCSAAELLLLQESQGTHAAARVCEGERTSGTAGTGEAGVMESEENIKGGRVTEKQGETGSGEMTTGAAHVTWTRG